MSNWYSAFFELGRLSGCHQMPERSFFYKSKQFPVCARCTGAFIGYFLGGAIYKIVSIPIWLAITFCIIMFVDWFLQKTEIIGSTNIRRLITGLLCGFGLMQIYIRAIIWTAIFLAPKWKAIPLMENIFTDWRFLLQK